MKNLVTKNYCFKNWSWHQHLKNHLTNQKHRSPPPEGVAVVVAVVAVVVGVCWRETERWFVFFIYRVKYHFSPCGLDHFASLVQMFHF
ncbi:hypothetical protein Hanom_Chr04g00307931 [Helianthus anomalus]